MAVGIEATDRTVAFAEDAATFFDKGFDLVDEFFFVELFFRGTVGLFNVLSRNPCVSGRDLELQGMAGGRNLPL